MARQEQRLYTVGPFWLAKPRADGRSPYLQIRWYDEAAGTGRSKSSGCTSLEDAIPVIIAHAQAHRSNLPQQPEEALVIGVLRKYWEEHGKDCIGSSTVEISLRTFAAFLDQDRVGMAAKVSDLTPAVFKRFMAWRMKPHSWDIDWRGKRYQHSSPGVNGESVQRNFNDIRAALNHAVGEGRLPHAPKVASVGDTLRSPPRDARIPLKDLGAIVAYASYDLPALRWVLAMIATGARPRAILKWDVAKQWDGGDLFNTHPFGAPVTKKRNAIVPIIPEFRPWLEAWASHPHPKVISRRTWWVTMREALDLPDSYIPKTIRHTVATQLRRRGVTLDDISPLLGHTSDRRITQVYARYSPDYQSKAKQELSAIWNEVCGYAHVWFSEHFRTTAAYGAPISIARKGEKC
jgi:integrase